MSHNPPPRYPVAAIPTTYRGCRFRSRLEARWAVFFDHIGIDWQYEPQGYNIAGRAYLPDFLLECGTWVEVKGSEDALDKPLMRAAAKQLPQMPASKEHGPQLMILGPLPLAAPFEKFVEGDYGWLALDAISEPIPAEYRDEFPDAIAYTRHGFAVFEKNRRPWYLDGDEGTGPWLRPTLDPYGYGVPEAYAAANSARFEHGERGF